MKPSAADAHCLETPSAWVVRWAGLIPHGRVLDVASGDGPHARFLKEKGFKVVAVDRDPKPVAGVTLVKTDLEDGTPWPFVGERFAGIVVTNYLHRPLFGAIQESLVENGILIYETFMLGNERYGKPSNPDFLLRPGELLQAFSALTVVAFEQGTVEAPKQAVIQRVCAVRGGAEKARIPP